MFYKNELVFNKKRSDEYNYVVRYLIVSWTTFQCNLFLRRYFFIKLNNEMFIYL